MTSETLSQEEIDLLFDGQKPSTPALGRARRPDVQVYDFRRPSRISKDRLRSLEAMYDLLAKSLENWLTTRLRAQVELNLLEVQQFSFGEFVMSLPTPCASFVFDIADSGGQQGVIDFGPEFSFFLVDRLLGGSGPTVVLDRALTPLERMMVRIAAERVASLISEIWRDHVRLELEVTRFESIPDMLQIANREDPVLVANIEVTADGTRSQLLLCLPFGVLEKFFTSSGMKRIHGPRGAEHEREADRRAVEAAILQTNVPVHVRLPEFELSVEQLASLNEGGVLLTGRAPDEEVEVYIAEQKRFKAVVRRTGRKLAVCITDEV
ncbi:MAG: FliM/FliN family flagellar motor switch protein [Gemmatimonadota bacterium]|jgi:flagellar motor switch protein FliM